MMPAKTDQAFPFFWSVNDPLKCHPGLFAARVLNHRYPDDFSREEGFDEQEGSQFGELRQDFAKQILQDLVRADVGHALGQGDGLSREGESRHAVPPFANGLKTVFSQHAQGHDNVEQLQMRGTGPNSDGPIFFFAGCRRNPSTVRSRR